MWLFDLDGTLALKGARSPFDWDRVGEDLPNVPVVNVARTLLRDGQELGFISGRKVQCELQTSLWLLHHLVLADIARLWMRADDDDRPDEIVKREIYEKHIKPYHVVDGVFDDRDKVVKAWRAMGLACFQVAEGNF